MTKLLLAVLAAALAALMLYALAHWIVPAPFGGHGTADGGALMLVAVIALMLSLSSGRKGLLVAALIGVATGIGFHLLDFPVISAVGWMVLMASVAAFAVSFAQQPSAAR